MFIDVSSALPPLRPSLSQSSQKAVSSTSERKLPYCNLGRNIENQSISKWGQINPENTLEINQEEFQCVACERKTENIDIPKGIDFRKQTHAFSQATIEYLGFRMSLMKTKCIKVQS